MERKNENAKDPRRHVPVDLPHVKPEDYKGEIEQMKKAPAKK